MDYGDGKVAEMKEIDPKISKDEIKKGINIGTSFHCHGSLLTFSFHVKPEKKVSCYLYWNATIQFFKPRDLEIVLPKIFNMDWNNGDNKKFINDKEIVGDEVNKPNYKKKINELIERMEQIITDGDFDKFSAFCGAYKLE